MKALLAFWKKDIINKLIVLISLALIVGVVGAIAAALIFLPQGGAAGFNIADLFPERPTPTFDVRVYFTPKTATVSPYTRTPTKTPPDFSNMPTITPQEQLPTATLDLTAEAGSALTLAAAINPPTGLAVFLTSTPTLAAGVSPVATTPVASPTPTKATPVGTLSGDGRACIPANPSKIGRVVEIVDVNTLRVLIEGPTYVVRYIGVAAPENAAFADAARLKNQEFAYGQEVTLVPGLAAKDDRGRLLYYVLAGDKFINLEIIKAGFGTALDSPPNNDCLSTFQAAQQQAILGGLGIWIKPTATPNP